MRSSEIGRPKPPTEVFAQPCTGLADQEQDDVSEFGRSLLWVVVFPAHRFPWVYPTTTRVWRLTR
ncbi:hypothetical protein PAXRUDRAFT_831159 [Paxillus rubicundulus Ve08.2h10]|uniref:Uncharacterized protein n=1 Tax=Paxillus rubicundulus Ve08.2h10 TaxID=930991 RepID=A0A0D0D3K8_9AGAM|nr:hypothetical protein PAXRUDRAFT_831159 [Paxillus rubicundulus Ve08.2h10]